MTALEAYLYAEAEPMTDEEIAMPFGPVQCHGCHAPLRDGGVWIDGEPYCEACAEERRR